MKKLVFAFGLSILFFNITKAQNIKGEKMRELSSETKNPKNQILSKKEVLTIENENKDIEVIKIKGTPANNGVNPLYILDGKEITSEEVNKIDKNKIDKIDILKDEKATQIYGEKAKNGVIVITSKKK
jgi:TonB-dependent SusC/RagA subfamily outer membrane receptor